jgi:hypothetical protein
MRANANLTRVTCSGIVDADDYTDSERVLLKDKGIEILPVSEIENIFLLPPVAVAIARAEGFDGAELDTKLKSVSAELFDQLNNPECLEPVIMRYCRRRIDRILKKIDLSDAANVEAISQAYIKQTGSLDIQAIAALARGNIKNAVTTRDVCAALRWYDNKGILAIASKLKCTSKAQFEQWIVRALLNDTAPAVRAAIKSILPTIEAA